MLEGDDQHMAGGESIFAPDVGESPCALNVTIQSSGRPVSGMVGETSLLTAMQDAIYR